MLRCRKWILTLGIAAAVPGITMAGLPSLFKPNSQARPAAATGQKKAATKTKNQRVAEDVAGALRAAKLKGYDIGIEYENGVATLTGMITDAGQKSKASKVASRILGVRMVDNRLKMIGQPTAGSSARPAATALRAAFRRAPIRQAAFSDGGRRRNSGILQIGGDGETLSPASEQPSFVTQAAETQDNQAVAERLGSALSSAKLNGYDISIQYQNGTATLNGAVRTPEQRARATQVAQQVTGVQLVDNRLQVAGQPQGNPYATASYQPMPPAGAPASKSPGPRWHRSLAEQSSRLSASSAAPRANSYRSRWPACECNLPES